jgi:hypothetical protein
MTEKEIINDALDSGIALNRFYLEKIEYLYDECDDESDRKLEYLIKIKETKRRIKTLEKLKN